MGSLSAKNANEKFSRLGTFKVLNKKNTLLNYEEKKSRSLVQAYRMQNKNFQSFINEGIFSPLLAIPFGFGWKSRIDNSITAAHLFSKKRN